jgi:hypothetical protein
MSSMVVSVIAVYIYSSLIKKDCKELFTGST